MSKGFAPPLIEPSTLKARLYNAVAQRNIDLFWLLNKKYKERYGHELTEQAMILLLNEYIKGDDKEALGWLIDNSKTTPKADKNGNLIGFSLEEPDTK